MDCPVSSAILEDRKRREEKLNEREAALKQNELELNKREAWLQQQEENRKQEERLYPFDIYCLQREKELNQKWETLQMREKEIRKREEAVSKRKDIVAIKEEQTEADCKLTKSAGTQTVLNLEKESKATVEIGTETQEPAEKDASTQTFIQDTVALRLIGTETKIQDVTKFDPIKSVIAGKVNSDKSSLSMKEENTTKGSAHIQEPERAQLETNVKESERNKGQTCIDSQFLYPKFSPFSGEDPKPKTEATFEEWKYEVNCIVQDGDHSNATIAQAIRKSLRGQAKRVLLPLGTMADIREIMNKLEGVFGNVATGESVLQEFYMASQREGETVAAWGLRLEEILQKAIEKGQVRKDEKNDMLRTKFWKSLRSERLKNATRVHFETISSFELLRRAVRAEEHEMMLNSGIRQQQMKVDNLPVDRSTEESKLDQLIARMSSLEKQIKYGNYPRRSWQNRQPSGRPDSKSEGKENSATDNKTTKEALN